MKTGSLINSAELKPYFDNLVEDQYTEPGYRYRRFGTLDVQNNEVSMREIDTFFQSKEINKSESGGIDRKFEPLEKSMLSSRAFNEIIKNFASYTGITEGIDVHQLRLTPKDDNTTAAPEGRHQDGYDYIGMFVVSRENLTGGEILAWKNIDDETPLFEDDIYHRFVIFNDRDHYHTATDLGIEDKSKPAWWDIIVLGGYNTK